MYSIAIPIAVAADLWFDEPTKCRKQSTNSDTTTSDTSERSADSDNLFQFVAQSHVVAILLALASLLLAGGASQTGRITASFRSRTYPLVGANLCLGIGLALVAFAPSVPVAVLGVIGLGASFRLLLSLYRSLITEHAPEKIRGRVVGLSEALGRVGSTAAPPVIGVLIGITQPVIGFGSVARWVSVGIGVVGGMVGVLLVVVASRHRRSRLHQAGSE